MGELLLPVALGAVIIGLGVQNMKGNISSLHRYHRKRVTEEDRIPFGRKVGLGSIIPLRTEGWPGIHHPRRRGHTQGMLPVCRGENGQPCTGYGGDGRPDRRPGCRIGTDLLRDDEV